MIYKKIEGGLYEIDPEHITKHRGVDCVRIEGRRSSPPEFLKVVQPMSFFIPWDCSEVWESL